MAAVENLDTHHKALTINLDLSVFGSFAEIGAGQEVARWFLIVGGASGTVAKTISAYDKEVSDDLYGAGSRYVSKERLQAMLEREWSQLLNQLEKSRGSQARFFSFVDTVSARNYAGTNESHGWLGVRFQQQPGGQASDIVLHINMRDPSNLLQQEAIGILGVSLIYAVVYQLQSAEHFLESLTVDVESRIEIDYVEMRGPAFETWDKRALLVQLVRKGVAQAVCFPASGDPVPPTEVIHKNPVVLAPGYFVHMDPGHAEIHTRMLASGIRQLQGERAETRTTPRGFFCLTLAPPGVNEPVGTSDLLHRIDTLRSHGGDVLLFREQELYAITDFVNRYTREPVRFVVGLSLMIRAWEDRYGKLEGSFLGALSRLLAQNVRIYAYPMTTVALKEAIQRTSASGWEWDETNGWVSARQLRPPLPRRHLYHYVLDCNFLVPIEDA